jgi:D-alanine-D-alanine ligase
MKIGMTYDLQENYLAQGLSEEETAEFDLPETIEAIEDMLVSLGYETDRIGNIQDLTRRLVFGDRWDLVFNIAEGLRGYGREAQVPALLDAYGIPYTFSDPLVLSLTLHKGMTKRVIRDAGIPTPAFSIVESISDVGSIDLPLPLFAKPVAEGTSKGINEASKITHKEELAPVCDRLIKTYKQPALVEIFLPGREFTVGILGTGKDAIAIGVIEVILKQEAESGAYSYWNKKRYEDLVEYYLVEDTMAKRAIEVALAAWQVLGCRDGGRVDIRADLNGVPNFLEVNPLAGLNPTLSDLCIIATKVGIPYRYLIQAITSSALTRCTSEGKNHAEMEDWNHLQRTRLPWTNQLGGIYGHSHAGGGR